MEALSGELIPLALVILAFNVTWGAAWSVLVLYTTEHLGLGAAFWGVVLGMASHLVLRPRASGTTPAGAESLRK